MKPTHLVLVIMGVLIAVIGVTALAGPPILNMLNGGGGNGRVSIVIATPTMMQGLVDATQDEAEQQSGQPPAPPAEDVGRTQTSSAGPAVVQDQDEQQQRAQDAVRAANVARALQDSSLDGLGNELADRLINSQRFNVKDTSQFMSALRDIGRRANDGGGQSFFQRLRFWENNSREENSTPEGKQTVSASEGEATLERLTSFDEADFRGAGQALGADYVLVVAIQPGGIRRNYGSSRYSEDRTQLRWTPTVIFRVFDVSSGNVVLAEESSVSPAIVVTETGRNETEIRRDLEQGLNDRVADMVSGRIMSVLAPARIISTADDAITINRGSNDGVREHDVYEVERELGEVRDVRSDGGDGVSLGRARDRIGQLRILSVQDNVATAAPVEGTLARGDIVVITPSSSRAVAVASTGPGQAGEIPLGEGQAVQGGPRASLAVGEFEVSLLEPVTWRYPPGPGVQLSLNIAGHLTQSGQVSILTRADADRLRAERERMARSQGVDEANVDLGLATAANLLTGEVRISGTRAGESISVGGQSRQTTTGWRLIATGTVRVQTTDGRTLYSVPVRTERAGAPTDSTAVSSVIDAFSQDAAAALLGQLYPIRVSQGAGNTLVLDRGPEVGLRNGTRLAVFNVDAATRTRQRLGEIIVTDAAVGYSATARFAAAPFAVAGGDVRAEIISGGAAPRARTARAPSQPQEPQPSQVQW
jgi:hypothetical protein